MRTSGVVALATALLMVVAGCQSGANTPTGTVQTGKPHTTATPTRTHIAPAVITLKTLGGNGGLKATAKDACPKDATASTTVPVVVTGVPEGHEYGVAFATTADGPDYLGSSAVRSFISYDITARSKSVTAYVPCTTMPKSSVLVVATFNDSDHWGAFDLSGVILKN